MKKFTTYTFRHLLLLATVLVVAGCTSNDYVVDDEEAVQKNGDVIALVIHRPGDKQLKAPAGGQYGEGFEQGNQWSPYLSKVDYDYKVKNLCIFFYQGGALTTPINSNYFTQILAKDYVSEEAIKLAEEQRHTDGHTDHVTDAQYELNIALLHRIQTNYKVVVVANMGDITNKVHYLGDLRDYLPSESFSLSTTENQGTFVYAHCDPASTDRKASVDGGAYSTFAMSIYEEPTFVVREGTLAAPHKVEVTLERLAARIDFNLSKYPSALSQKEDAFAPIPYEVKANEGGETLAKNWITHCRLVNSMQRPSFSIRRTADDPNTIPTQSPAVFLGSEKTTPEKISQNYILSPYTRNITNYLPYSLFGTSTLSEAKEEEFTNAERVISRKAFAPYNGGYVGTASALAFDDASPNYFIVGFANENTLRPENMTRNYTTGLLYRSIYEPATVWRYDGSGIVSTTVSNLTTDVLSDGSVPAGGYKSDHYGKTFWMIERLVPNPTEADRAYFVADGDGDQDAEGVTTFSGREKIEAAVKLYIAAHNDTGWTAPYEYVNGVAYNYYWIRHSNSQGTGQPFSPMEYSIVRNNIYRIGITSFSGPGAPSTDPGMDNPDRIQPITYVHKWHPYTVKEVNM